LIRTKKTETIRANVKKKKSIVPWACAVQEGVDSEWQMLKLFINSMLHSWQGMMAFLAALATKGFLVSSFCQTFFSK
jgi:hypothetical protein